MSSEIVAQKTKATAHTNTITPEEPQKKLVGDALKEAIKRQVEFYFSRGNLANDAYLVSQMNSQMFVPVEVIINFSKIKQLTDDTTLLVDAIRDSTVCILNATENAIKPNIKSERNTIILREIPSDTKPEEVKAIFDGCGKVESVRSDVGDTWFVTMVSEDEAVKTLLSLRSKTFNNGPIKARLKSENLLKSFYPSQPAEATVPVPTAFSYMQGTGYYGTPVRGYYDMSAAYGGVQYNAAPNAGVNQYNNTGAENNRYTGRSAGNQGRGGNHQHFRTNGGRSHSTPQQQGQQQQISKEGGRHKSNSFDQRPNNGKKNKDKRGYKNQNTNTNQLKRSFSTPTERQPILNAANFPPLPSNPTEQKGGETIVAVNKKPIQFKYTHEDIMEIVKNMDDKDCILAQGKMDYETHSVALTSDAHPDLLRNQRTYSIEEARDAMRQGRPIRSDSIGSIDYESMMYGEDYTKEAREQRKQKASVEATVKSASTPSTPSSKKETMPGKTPADKVLGYAAAVINGAPAPPPVVETSAISSTFGAAGSTCATTTGKKKNQKKTPKGDDKKNKKKNHTEAAAPLDDLPKSGAWGGRNFLDVVKSAPTEVLPSPSPATPKATPLVTTTPIAPSAKKKNSLEQEKEKITPTPSEGQSEK